MEGSPPPYTDNVSRQIIMTRRQSENEEVIVFVEAVIKQTFWPYPDATAHVYCRNGSIYHTHKKIGGMGKDRKSEVQLVVIQRGLGYQTLFERLVSAACSESNWDQVARGRKRSITEVAGVQVVWEDLRLDDKKKFETWMSGSQGSTGLIWKRWRNVDGGTAW